ncbi:short chain dehydrogenase/reductase-like protein [Mucidula mucida]|nr:short chain dehydrogenase/reductase-like protein [Mucidula mucida]
MPTSTLPRKCALITGCREGGIGGALAREFHSNGLRVFATARSASQLADLEALGIETFSLDVTSRPQIAALAAEISTRTGGTLDILVNNAGRASNIPALDESDDDMRSVFETNLFSVIRMVNEFSALLIKAKGTIVNIGSVTAFVPLTFGATYNASKAALHQYSDTLRIELAPFDVQVIVIITGGVKSNLTAMKRKLPPDSLYQPINTEYQARQGMSRLTAMSNTVYARSVVSQILKKNPPKWIWKGTSAWLVWVLTFLPRGFMSWIFKDRFGIGKLRRYVRMGKTE